MEAALIYRNKYLIKIVGKY